jgi:hypothetical protein
LLNKLVYIPWFQHLVKVKSIQDGACPVLSALNLHIANASCATRHGTATTPGRFKRGREPKNNAPERGSLLPRVAQAARHFIIKEKANSFFLRKRQELWLFIKKRENDPVYKETRLKNHTTRKPDKPTTLKA